MTQNVSTVGARQKSQAVAVGTPQVLDMSMYGFPCTVTAVPQGGGSLAIEYSTSPRAAGNAGGATWQAWPSGTVSSTTSNTLISPVTAIRVTATTAAGVVEIFG